MLPRLLLAAGLLTPLLASCAGNDLAPDRSAASDARLAKNLAGKVAGKPVSCLPHYSSNDMEVIDRDTILFHHGSTVYVQNTRGPCYPYGNIGGYALVTRSVGSSGLCQGDIAQVVYTSTGTFAGNCLFNEFVPYRRASR